MSTIKVAMHRNAVSTAPTNNLRCVARLTHRRSAAVPIGTSLSRRPPSAQKARQSLRVLNKQYTEEKREEITKKWKQRDVQSFKNSLQRAGINSTAAQKIVDVWQRTGLDDPERVRKMLLRRSTANVLSVLLQLGLDIAAAYAAYNTSLLWGFTRQFGDFTPIATAPLLLLSGYFASGFFFDCFTLGALFYASVQYQTNSAAFMEAVKEIAGTTGLNVVDKGRQAVNTVKVMDALNKMAAALKEDASTSGGPGSMLSGPGSMLSGLSAYLTLDKAKAELNFDPKNFNMSDEEAAKIAATFSKYDSNDDGRLSQQEFRQLASEMNGVLSGSETDAAFRLLDKDNSGYIDFVEFVDWYKGKVGA